MSTISDDTEILLPCPAIMTVTMTHRGQRRFSGETAGRGDGVSSSAPKLRGCPPDHAMADTDRKSINGVQSESRCHEMAGADRKRINGVQSESRCHAMAGADRKKNQRCAERVSMSRDGGRRPEKNQRCAERVSMKPACPGTRGVDSDWAGSPGTPGGAGRAVRKRWRRRDAPCSSGPAPRRPSACRRWRARWIPWWPGSCTARSWRRPRPPSG